MVIGSVMSELERTREIICANHLPIFRMWKLRLKEGNRHASDHQGQKQSWGQACFLMPGARHHFHR